jgi:integrase
MADTRLKRVVGQYLQEERNRNISERYLGKKARALRAFADWCETEKGVTATTKVTAQMIGEYMSRLDDMGGSTQRVEWCILRSFLRYAGSRVGDTYRYRARGPDRFKVRWLSGEQVRTLLDAPLEPAERLLVSFGLYAGLRMREVLDMRVSEAQTALTTGWLVVRGKGYKSRPVYLHPKLKDALSDYLRATDLAPSARLMPFSEHTYDQKLRDVGRARGFELSSHDLRRTHAAELCEGQDLDVACLSLGHASPQMTAKYAGAQMVRLQRAIERLDYASGVHTPTRPVV